MKTKKQTTWAAVKAGRKLAEIIGGFFMINYEFKLKVIALFNIIYNKLGIKLKYQRLFVTWWSKFVTQISPIPLPERLKRRFQFPEFCVSEGRPA